MEGFRLGRFSVGSVLLLFAPVAAVADGGDLLSISAGSTKTHYDNLFKRPSDGSFGSVSSDSVVIAQIGILAKKAVSLQSFELAVSVVDSRYDQFGELDSRSNSYNAAWRWQFTPNLTGNITATRQQAQTDFADFRGPGQNLRTTETRRLNADWSIVGGWTLGAGTTRTKQTNSQTFTQDSGSEQQVADAMLKYAFASGASIALLSSASSGDYQRTADPLTLSDSRFSDRRNDLRLEWPITGKTKIAANIGQISRKNEHFSARDYAGRNESLNFVWAATGKTSISFAHARTMENWEDTSSSFAVRKTDSLSCSWQMSAKLSLRAGMDRETRTYGGFALVPATLARIDRTNKESISLEWAALRNLTVAATAQKSSRASNSPGLDYQDRLATVSISATF